MASALCGGRPPSRAEVKISDEGEILCRHDGAKPGYYPDEEQTRAAFTAEGLLKTGDKGHFDADGYLYIDGRIKEIFKTEKGKYVAPAPIESQLAMLPFIDACCVDRHRLSAAVRDSHHVGGDYRRFRDQEARKKVSGHLATHMLSLNDELEPHARLGFLVVLPGKLVAENGSPRRR
jgi:long-chain acyl-CoA synthetase